MVFVQNTIADVFIFIGIIVGGLALIGLVVWLVLKAMAEEAERIPAVDSERRDDRLSKISHNDWNKPTGHAKQPVILEQDAVGRFKVKLQDSPTGLGRDAGHDEEVA